MNKEEFILKCKELNIEITDVIYSKLCTYFELLVSWNKKFNMTNILDEKDVFLLHFYDSLCLVKAFKYNEELSLCDFGTGAGFPGMIIALLFKNISVTLIESNQKKCMFLNEVKNQLNISNIHIVCDRIENYGIKNRECFDLVTCRAVTSIPMIIELSTSVLKVGGYLIPLKTNCIDEIIKYKKLESEFNLNLDGIIKYNLPINDAIRMIPKYRKICITNKKYPRSYASILKSYKNK